MRAETKLLLKKIKVLVDKGLKHKEIGAVLDLTANYIACLCSDNNIKSKIPDYVSEQDAIRIRDLLNDGFTYKEAAKKINMRPSKLRNFCYRHDITYKRNNKRMTSLIEKKILELLNKKMNATEIAKKFKDITPRMVSYYRIKHNISPAFIGHPVNKVSDEETTYLKELLKKPTTMYRISVEMGKKFKRRYSHETIRGRCRSLHVSPIPIVDGWTSHEISILKRLYEDLGYSYSLLPRYQQLLPNRTLEGIRKKIKSII